MNPVEAILSVLSKYLSVEGRASRSEFWWWTLTLFVIGLGLGLFEVSRMTPDQIGKISQGEAYFGLSGILAIATFIPNITVSIRRLHDTGRSGFWWFILLVPFVGGIIFLVLMCLPSQDRKNRFGNYPGYRGQVGSATGAYSSLYQPDPEEAATIQANRKSEISDYYRKNVLKQS